MTFANTLDTAGALFASSMVPMLTAPLQVSTIHPYVTTYGKIGIPYTFGCGSFDPHCLYTGVGFY